MITITASWLFDTITRFALLAISLTFLVTHMYEMIAYAMALQAYSIVNPFGPSSTIFGLHLNIFHAPASEAAYRIFDIFQPSPFNW